MSTQEVTRSIAWGRTTVVPKRPHVYRVVSPRPREPHVVGVILSSTWLKVWTHYRKDHDNPKKGHPEPHWEPAAQCEGCQQLNQRPRAKFYAPAFLIGNSRVVLFELTEGAPEFEPRIEDEAFDWRGYHVRLFRVGESARSRVNIEVNRKDTGRLPVAPPLEPSLEVLWGLRANTLQPSSLTGKGGAR